ncbi:uncharacterized protein [Nicotiana sylvestris]|uniref:uncharacterized protein n=1 Tax=Nicotiana sylvestris TaxID=4096 RepID=UPI00388CE718
MGLNESYINIKSNVLAKRLVATVNEAYAIATQKESQKSLGVVNTHREPLTILAGRGQDFKGKGPWIICEHCGYKGHLKENCFKIISYPTDFKSKKKNQTGGGKIYTNSVNVNNEEGRAAAAAQVQYKQLVKLLSKLATLECSTNMIGIISLLANAVLKLTRDLSCSVTFFPDFCMFQDLYSGRVMDIGREHNGLYLLKENITVVAAGFFMNKGAESKLWHLRLGHASLKSMQHISELKNKVDIQVNLPGGDKFTPRARKSVLIGYSETQTGYNLYDLDSRRVFINRDVSFREQVFPFKEGTQITVNIFPCAEPHVTNDFLPEQLVQGSSNKEQATTEDSNFSTAHDQIEPAHDHVSPTPVMESTIVAYTQTMEPTETTVDSVDTFTMHQSIEQVGVQLVTDPDLSQSYIEQVHTDETGVRISSRYKTFHMAEGLCYTLKHSESSSLYLKHCVLLSFVSQLQGLLGVFSATVELKNFKEACQDKNWVEAMSQEIKALEDNAS